MPQKRKADQEPPKPHSKTSKNEPKPPTNHLNAYPTSHIYRLIEPGPVLLVTTGSLTNSSHNIMTIGFHMMMQHESPALIGITLGPWDASFKPLQETRECVLSVPSIEIAETVVDIGNCSSKDSKVNKFDRFGLCAVPGEKVQAPLVGGPHVLANVECVVEDVSMVEKYSMWVLRAVKAWVNPDGGTMFHHRGQGVMVADGEVVDLKERMVKWQEFMD